MSHIRIESHEKIAKDVKVFFVDGDDETDISGCVQVVDIHLGVGEMVTATLRTITGHASVTAKIEDIVNTHVRRSWWNRLRRRSRDVTTVADRTRRYA